MNSFLHKTKRLPFAPKWSTIKESLTTYYPPAIRMFGAGLQFIATIFIARNLGETGAAQFFYWSAILMTSAPMAAYGLEQIALRDIPRIREKGIYSVRVYLASIRTISLILSIIIGFILTIYGCFAEGFHIYLLMMPIGLVAMSGLLVNGEAMKGLSRPVLGVVFGHFIPVSLFCFTSVFFTEHLSSIGLFVCWILCYVIGYLAVPLSKLEEFSGLSPKPNPDRIKSLRKEGLPVCFAVVLGALSFMIPLSILRWISPPEEVSFVTTSFRISILFTILATAVHAVFAPNISKATEGRIDGRNLFTVYRKAVIYTLVGLSVPLLIGIIFPQFIMSIFGDGFVGGAPTLRILLLVNLFSLLLGPVLQLLVMTNQSDLLPKLGITKLSIVFILALFLVPRYGGVGMAISMAIAFLQEEILGLFFVWRKVRNQK